jgi:hypothetical protein
MRQQSEHIRPRIPPTSAARGSRRVAFATVAAGDQVIYNGHRRQIAAVVQTRTGFIVQFPDATALHIICPPEVCEIDGRQVRLDGIATDACFWCGSARRLVAVGRYTAQFGHEHTVHACTGCIATRGLLPLATRTANDTQVRYRQGRTP